MNKLVINVFGAPNAGKTVAASSIFAKLKKHHIDTLLVGEFARDMVVENNQLALQDQLFIWASQYHRIFCSHQHAQITVTDSPILLGALYQSPQTHSAIYDVILDCHKKFNNFNILLELDTTRPYSMVGRIHNLEQSLAIESHLRGILESHSIPFIRYNEYDENELVDIILEGIR